MTMPLLAIEDLAVAFRADEGWTPAVDGVSLAMAPGATLGIVGESGSGKSVTALSLLRLHAARTTRLSGRILFEGQDILAMSERALRRLRGSDMAMVFQDPIHSLNPVLTVGEQIAETLRIHQRLDAAAARARSLELMQMVRLPDAARRLDDYPHRLSGGQRQRIMIAMAIACRPKLLIADEPTTALDVTIQAQIIDLLRDLRDEIGMAVILISHDLGLVADFAERVVVMYAGQIVEDAPAERLFRAPVHPYTAGLLAAIPDLDRDLDRLHAIEGTVPDPAHRPPGCRYAPRCPFVQETCRHSPPPMLRLDARHEARCPVRARQQRPRIVA